MTSYHPEFRASWTLEALKRNDQQAWHQAFRELSRIAGAVIRRRIFSVATIEDLIQSSLQEVCEQINTFADDGHIRRMVAIVAQRKASHHLRDETAGKRDRRRETNLDSAINVPERDSTPWWVTYDLEVLLRDLTALDRELLLGYFVEGLKSHELSARHRLTASTVRGRIMKALEILRTKHAGSQGGGMPVMPVALWLAMATLRWVADFSKEIPS